MQAEMPRAASLLHGSSRVLSKAPNGRATDSGIDTPSGTCMRHYAFVSCDDCLVLLQAYLCAASQVQAD